MASIETLIEQVRAVLIQTEDSKPRHEIYNQFVNEAKANNLTEDDFYKKILKVAHKSIDWNYIEGQKQQKEREKKEKEEREKAVEIEMEELKKHIQHAPKFIDRLIKTAFEDDMVGKNELLRIFDRSDRLNQDTYELADKIDHLLQEKNFKSYPKANFDLPTLRLTLCSTDWHNESRYRKLTTPPPPPPEPFPMKMALIGGALFLLVASSFVYFFYLKPKWRDDSAVAQNGYYYPIAEPFLMLNSTKVDKISENDIASLEYGTKMIVYDIESEWLTVKAKDKEGYVNPRYTLNRKDFTILNSIWGDGDAKASIESNKCRVAILNYFKQNSLIGKIDEDTQKDVFGVPQTSKDCWQVFAKGKDVKPNTVVFPHIVNPSSKFSDFGVIIKNTSTNKRKFLLFSFSDTEESTLVNEQDAPDSGYIKEVRKFFRNGNFVYDVIYSY